MIGSYGNLTGCQTSYAWDSCKTTKPDCGCDAYSRAVPRLTLGGRGNGEPIDVATTRPADVARRDQRPGRIERAGTQPLGPAGDWCSLQSPVRCLPLCITLFPAPPVLPDTPSIVCTISARHARSRWWPGTTSSRSAAGLLPTSSGGV